MTHSGTQSASRTWGGATAGREHSGSSGTIPLLALGSMGIPADQLQQLFDALPDVVFFVKDRDERYTHVNLTLVRRLGLKRRDEVIGRRVDELFSSTLSVAHADQDRRVLAGERFDNHLEIHLFPRGGPSWCLTRKEPLYVGDRIHGIVGLSRDLGQLERDGRTYQRLRAVLDHLSNHFGDVVRMSELAEQAGLSVAQLERLVRRVFQLTPQQLLAKFRIDAAMRMLAVKGSIAAIGQACGFSDQSALARQFKATVGMSPRAYRNYICAKKVDAVPTAHDSTPAPRANMEILDTRDSIAGPQRVCAERVPRITQSRVEVRSAI